MTYSIKATLAAACLCAVFATPSFATDNKTKTAEPLTANSTAELKKKFQGKHIDQLPEAEEATKAVDNPDRVVCKKIDKLGTRLRKRKVCATKKEWDMMKTNSVNAVRQMQVTRNAVD